MELPEEQIKQITQITVVARTSRPEILQDIREKHQQAKQALQSDGMPKVAAFMDALLSVLNGETPSLPEDNPYAPHLQRVLDYIANYDPSAPSHNDIMGAIKSFLTTSDWAEARQVYAEHEAVLSLPQVEGIFEQNIAEEDDDKWKRVLQAHLDRIRKAKADGLDAAFPESDNDTPPPVSAPDENDDSDEDTLAQLADALLQDDDALLALLRSADDDDDLAQLADILDDDALARLAARVDATQSDADALQARLDAFKSARNTNDKE